MSPVTRARPVDQGRLQGLSLTRLNWTGMATLWLQTLSTRVRVDAVQVGPVLGSGFDSETVFGIASEAVFFEAAADGGRDWRVGPWRDFDHRVGLAVAHLLLLAHRAKVSDHDRSFLLKRELQSLEKRRHHRSGPERGILVSVSLHLLNKTSKFITQ